MAFIRPRTVAGNTWPPLPTPAAGPVWAAYLALDRTQWLAPEEIERQQLAQVRTLLAHCREHVPFYARRLPVPGDVRTLADYRRIPLLPRQTYQVNAAEFVARQLPPGTVPAGQVSTSGSSGIPVTVRQTNLVQLWWLALTLRDLEWCGLDPRGTLAAVRYMFARGERGQVFRDGATTPFWNRALDPVIATGPCHLMDVHQDPRKQLAWLRGLGPDYLLSYPSNLEFLAGLIRDEGRPLPGLKCIQAISETLTDEARARIEAGFGVPVKNTYSCQEAGYLASPCPAGHGLHVHAENVLLEVLDETGGPCEPGRPGRVVLTALHNFLTPLVRYEIQDGATLVADRCPCGRGLPRLSGLTGKERPLFHLPDGRRKNSNRLALMLRKVGGFHQFRLIQTSVDLLVVRIVPDRTWSPELEEQFRKKAEEFFEGPVRVLVETADRLELTPGGKSVDVVCEVPERT